MGISIAGLVVWSLYVYCRGSLVRELWIHLPRGEAKKQKQNKNCKAQETPLLKVFQSFLASLRVWLKIFSTLYGNLTTTISLTSSPTILPFSHSVPALLFLDHTRNIPTSGLPPVLSPLLEVLPSGPQIIHPSNFFRDFTESVSLSFESQFVSPYSHLWASAVTQWVKRICLLCRRHIRNRFDPWVGKIPWRRKMATY